MCWNRSCVSHKDIATAAAEINHCTEANFDNHQKQFHKAIGNYQQQIHSPVDAMFLKTLFMIAQNASKCLKQVPHCQVLVSIRAENKSVCRARSAAHWVHQGLKSMDCLAKYCTCWSKLNMRRVAQCLHLTGRRACPGWRTEGPSWQP